MATNFSSGIITVAENPCMFYVKLYSQKEEGRKINAKLNGVPLKFLREFKTHTMCMVLVNDAAKFKRERGRIVMDAERTPDCKVLLVDQGVHLTLSKLSLYELPEDLANRGPLAWPCSLKDVTQEDLSAESKMIFKRLFTGVECDVAFQGDPVKLLRNFAPTWTVYLKTRFTENASLIYNTAASFYA